MKKVVGELDKIEMGFYKTDSSDNNDEIEFNKSYNCKSDNGNSNDIEMLNCYFEDRRNDKRRNDI